MASTVDHYATLQVDPRADPEVIRAAYRTLARRYHPDLADGLEAQMAALNNAWAVLRDAGARAAYDRSRLVPPGAPTSAATEQATAPHAPDRPGHPSGSVLEFGRYAGWSFGELAQHDPNFLEWLARSPGGRRYRREIETLLAPAAEPRARATVRRGRFRR
jgi:curved DNA-binding protein CbpA